MLVLGLSVPAFAASEADTASGVPEQTLEGTTDEAITTDEGTTTDVTGTVGEALEDVDEALDSTEEQVDETAAEGPEPVAETVDDTTDTTTDTTDAVTDTLQQTVEDPTDPTDPSDGEGSPDNDRRGAGDDPTSAPAPDGRSIAGGGTSAPPTRVALDGFRRTSGGTSTDLAVTADPIFEPEEPAFAPPTTREVVEPSATAAPRLSLRTVAIEILVATALLVMATGGLIVELGPERS